MIRPIIGWISLFSGKNAAVWRQFGYILAKMFRKSSNHLLSVWRALLWRPDKYSACTENSLYTLEKLWQAEKLFTSNKFCSSSFEIVSQKKISSIIKFENACSDATVLWFTRCDLSGLQVINLTDSLNRFLHIYYPYIFRLKIDERSPARWCSLIRTG